MAPQAPSNHSPTAYETYMGWTVVLVSLCSDRVHGARVGCNMVAMPLSRNLVESSSGSVLRHMRTCAGRLSDCCNTAYHVFFCCSCHNSNWCFTSCGQCEGPAKLSSCMCLHHGCERADRDSIHKGKQHSLTCNGFTVTVNKVPGSV